MKSHKVCYVVLLLQKLNLRKTDSRNVVLCLFISPAKACCGLAEHGPLVMYAV